MKCFAGWKLGNRRVALVFQTYMENHLQSFYDLTKGLFQHLSFPLKTEKPCDYRKPSDGEVSL